MIVRKPYLRASEIMQKRVKEKENIEILFETNTLGLFGENGVEGAHPVRHKGEANEEKFDIAIDGFFLAIGHKPNTDLFKDFIDLDEQGFIKVVPGTASTNLPGIFAAGDVADPVYRQGIVAAGSVPRLRSRQTDSCSNSKNYSIKSYKAGVNIVKK